MLTKPEQGKRGETYVKLEQREHVLLRPDTYTGSLNPTTEEQWCMSAPPHSGEGVTEQSIKLQSTTYIPTMYKIFDELLVNAMDQSVLDETLDVIKVEINDEEGWISVMNNGKGIPVEKHTTHDIWIPEMIFGHLLTSSNYNDSEERVTGGRNGYGAKLTNIWSTRFVLEVVDTVDSKKYVQIFENNMSVINKPKITTHGRGQKGPANGGRVMIKFYPDLKRMGVNKLSSAADISLFNKRVHDAAACTSSKVKVYLNGTQLKIKTFDKYIDMYIGQKSVSPRVYEASDRWAVCVAPAESFKSVGFVNGVACNRGTHIDYVVGYLIRKITEYITSKHKNIKLKPAFIKEHLFVFVKCTIVNPSFSSQTKDECTTRSNAFGSRCELSDNFIKQVTKLGIIDEIINLAKFKEQKELNKTDGRKRNVIRGIPKLDDANKAGSHESGKCTLCLTEGDSAKAFVISGLSVVGRDHWGVFPLRGKLLNVKEATVQQLLKNEEINNLKQIMGLEQNKKYNSPSELRYGSIMICTDADDDGFHIRGLLMNLFSTFWPELLKHEGFIRSLVTPVVKVTKRGRTKEFYNLYEYKEWKATNEAAEGGWNTKYYKGLGTSTAAEAREYFKNIRDNGNQLKYKLDSTGSCMERLNLAFAKTEADKRKVWVTQTISPDGVKYEKGATVSYSQFIDKELIQFSIADVKRSIPSVIDGLKPSQRKVLYGCMKRNLTSDMKVAQLSGYISEHTAYHHGEMSLQGCIIDMAQDYTGSNNINLLMPKGQFGTRIMGGKDHASPRYIFTQLNSATRRIFRPEDDATLKYQDDDGFKIEPEVYYPMIPMVLVNGTQGIGTGYSTSVPCYNPRDIIENIKRYLSGSEFLEMVPWYRNFTGKITPKPEENAFTTHGDFNIKSKTQLEITELPVGMWTQNYKEFLEALVSGESKSKNKLALLLTDYENHSTEEKPRFLLKFNRSTNLSENYSKDDIESALKLTTSISLRNMHLFDSSCKIKKYESPLDILREFCKVRLAKTEERRQFLVKQIAAQVDVETSKVRFIEAIMNDDLVIFKKKKDAVVSELKEMKFQEVNGSYNYLLDMKVHCFTDERIVELKNSLESKMKLMHTLKTTTAKNMWNGDLETLQT